MNGKLAVLILVLTSGLLSGCAARTDKGRPTDELDVAAHTADAVDRAATGNANYKTWVVHTIGSGEDPHMIPGDAFRLQKVGKGYQIKPLKNLLEERWGYPQGSDYVVDLEKINPALLCGEVTFKAHEPAIHRITIKVVEDDFLLVEFMSPENSCTSQDTHGGTAHAQN